MAVIKAKDNTCVADIGGKLVQYDYSSNYLITKVERKRQHITYVGKGVVYSIGGVKQLAGQQKFFYVKEERLAARKKSAWVRRGSSMP